MEANGSYPRVATHYIQMVTALNAKPDDVIVVSTNNMHAHEVPTAVVVKTEALKPQTTPTDFENLIEMNARKTSIIPNKMPLETSTAIAFDAKQINTTAAVGSPFSTIVVPSSSSPFSTVAKGVKHPLVPTSTLKLKSSILQPMEVDEITAKTIHSQMDLASPKFHLNMENNKLINKVKIVVDNMTNNATTGKIRADLYENSNYHMHQQQNQHLQPHPMHQPLFNNLNFHGNFHLYEYNQNNQNILNQNRQELIHNNNSNHNNNAVDENMWRPW